jgi:CysZ protein
MEFFRGLGYLFRGLAVLRRTPGLARYWLPPIIITALALLASLILTSAYYDDLVALIWTAPETGGFWGFFIGIAYWLVRAVAFLLSLSLLVLLCIGLSTLIAAPFNDALSEAIEEGESGRPAPPFSLARMTKDVVRTVRVELLKLTIYVSVMGPLLVASWLVPGAGQIAYVLFGALFTSAYFAFDYIDWPASRRSLGIRARLSIFARRPLRMFGFGLGVWACLFVPLLNLCFMPIAVAGGTLLFLDLSQLSGGPRPLSRSPLAGENASPATRRDPA